MNDISAAVVDILNTFDEPEYPAGFLEKYVPMECLACSHGTETFLVKQKTGERFYVAKFYDKNLYSFVHESNILKSLHHISLPAFVDEFQDDKVVCIVREYMEGKPLNQFATENNLTRKDVIGICVQLCDILAYIHGREKPVIHRDIKPQNIIVKDDGQVILIDFDIARIYRSGADTDTQFFGTREYAPPGQYGFSQTDCRTDIYSIGVVLGWLLTGETNAKEVIRKLGHDRLASVYKKCTAFSPENRFSSAAKLKSALLHTGDRCKKSALGWMAAILSCMAFLCAGFSIGRYTDFLSSVLEPSVRVAFEEPMIEKAVRFQLDKAADEIITEGDLLSVTELYIFGDALIAKTGEELHSAADRLIKSNKMKEGPIRSLADLAKMPNLKQISISMQEISDISPLAVLNNLEAVDIKNNPVTDISPLGKLKFLKRACLFDTRVTDLSPLANCSMLNDIDAGKLPVRSPAAFEIFSNLQRLNLYETTIDTLDGIEKLAQLRFIEVTNVIDGDLTPLLSLAYLENVILGEGMRHAAEAIEDKAKFAISYR